MKNMLKNVIHTLSRDMYLIILSLVVSIIVWFAVSIQIFPNVKSHIDQIPVAATLPGHMVDNNLQLAEAFKKNVTIQIQGKRYDIGKLTNKDFTASLDLSNVYTAGEYTVDIVIKKADNNDCEVLTNNLSATIKVVKIITKEFTIVPATNGIVTAEGFKVETDDLVVNPTTVSITGEEKLVNSIKKAEANAVYDDVLTTTSEVKGDLRLYNANDTRIENPDLSFNNDAFTVTVPVYKVKTLPLDISFINVPKNFNIKGLHYTIFPSEITIASPDSSIDNLEKFEVDEIDLSQITPRNLQSTTLTVKLPDGYKNISKVRTARITFDDADSYGSLAFTIPSANINIINAPSDYDITVLTAQLPVTVVGPSNDIHKMISSDISVTANLLGTEISEGTKTISVSFKIPGNNVNSWVSGEYSIDIEATKPAETAQTEP